MKKAKLLISVVLVLSLLISASCIPIGGAKEGNVALIRLNGSIAESATFFGSAITPKQVKGYLDKAEKDGAIKAVILRINSPGGSAAASQEIAGMIKDFEKPVVVSMGDIAVSGGYYISVYSDWIVAQPATTTGSIGVITMLMDVSGLMEKLGIKPETIKSGKYKDMFTGMRPLTEKEEEILQKLCDDAYEDFINAVAEGRGIKTKEVRNLATGQVYTGEQAKGLGLVDELGGLEEAKEKAAELAGIKKPKVEEYKPPKPWWMKFLPGFLESKPKSPVSPSILLLLKALRGWQAKICY